MRVLIQRVSQAEVSVDGKVCGAISRGYLLLVGFCGSDSEAVLQKMARKIYEIRINEDENGKMNLAVDQIGGAILSVSQFTLYADCRHGRRPGFTQAAPADQARSLYRRFNEILSSYPLKVETGQFQADMKVSLINDGPVTIWLDSVDMED